MATATARTHHFHHLDSGVHAELQNLRYLARQETNGPAFVTALAQVAGNLIGARTVRVWQRREHDELVEIESPRSHGAEAGPSRELLQSVMAQRTIRIVPDADPAHPSDLWVLAPLVGGVNVLGVIAAAIPAAEEADIHAAVTALMPTIVDAALPFFEARFTGDLLAERNFDHQFREFCRMLHVEPALATTPATIGQEYQRLFQADRVWILMRSGRRWHVTAVSGIPGFQRRAEVVRRLEQLVSLLARTKQPFQWSAGTTPSGSARIRESLDRYLDEAHVSRLRLDPLILPEPDSGPETEKSNPAPLGIAICEWFQPAKHSTTESRWTAAAKQAALALQDADDWSRAPLAHRLRSWRRHSSWRKMTGWTGLAVAIGIATGLLAAMPMDFTIDAIGELQPVRQRHVFATSNGIVQTLSVSTGDEISAGATLLSLESPELELETRRVEGELQTTEKRIAAIEASRLDHGLGSSETVSQMNTLAGDLSEQKQQRDNLRRELELLQLRRDELKLTSPIGGRVVTWDLGRLLTRRPVSRGQRLMTIADTSGPWQLELRVPDEDAGELQAALRGSQSVPLDFIVVSLPGEVRSTTVRSVLETVEVRSPGENPTLLCLADVPETVAASATAGLGVRGRIHCGKRAAVVVGFSKLWRAIQEHILFPWGW